MLQRRFQASGLFAQPRDGFLLPGDLGGAGGVADSRTKT